MQNATIKIDLSKHELPRLADFAEFTLFLEAGNGWEIGGTIEALKENYSTALESIADEGPVPAALKKFIDFQGSWTGTATQLLEELEGRTDDKIIKTKEWPSSPAKLSNIIARSIDVFQNIGITVTKERDKTGSRVLTIESKRGLQRENAEIPF